MRPGVVAPLATMVAAVLVSGCERAGPGTPVTAQGTVSSTTGSTTEPAPPSVPGVATTLPDTIPPDALACFQPPDAAGVATVAQVGDPAAPRITVDVPLGWIATPGGATPEVALTLTGPDGLTGSVTIAQTPLDPGAAFDAYGDAVFDNSGVSVLNVMPAEFCGYSSQRLFGNWSDQAGQTTEHADRIAHIWTETGDYLVTVHLQGPAGAPGFDVARDLLTADFSIVIP